MIDNESQQSKASIRNNLMIVFFLVVVISGVSLTWMLDNTLRTILKEYDITRSVSMKIGNDFTMISTGMTMVGMVVFLVVAWFLAETIAGPIKKLNKAVETVASGDRNVIFDVQADDEIGDLSRSFNKMLGTLRETTVSRDFVDSIVSTMTDGLVVTSRDGTIISVNAAILQFLGYRKEELEGRPVSMLFLETGRGAFGNKTLRQFSEEARAKVKEVELRTRTGKGVTVLFSTGVLKNQKGETEYIICTIKDVSEFKTAEKEIKTLAKFPSEDPNPVLRVSRFGEVLYSNEAGIRVLNTWGTSVAGILPARVMELVNQVKETGHSLISMEDCGGKIYMFTVVPVVSEEYVNFYGHDVTEQKIAEEGLRRSTEFSRTILDNIGEAISIVDVNTFNIVGCNRAFLKEYELNENEAVGRLCFDITHKLTEPCSDPSHLCPITEMIARGLTTYKVEHMHYTKSGEKKYVEVFASPITDKDGKIVQAIHITRDVTETREFEKTRRLAEMGKLVSHMAHEINNPLMVISGRAQIELMKEIKDEELKESLLAIVKSSDNTKAIIQRLLRFARPGKGVATGVNINDVITETVDLVAHQFQISNIEVRRNLLPSPVLCNLDPKQLQEVIMNLINNAREAIAEAGSIEISTSIQEKWAKIEVKDSGKGMDERTLNKIGDLFYTTKVHGSGMGLSITFNILKACGGSLRYSSVPGKGTTATVLLPLQ